MPRHPEESRYSCLTEEQRDLVEKNLNLVHYVLKKYLRTTPGNPKYEDYFNQGVVGLCVAVKRFNPELGFNLSTYASSMIYGEIRRYRRDCESPYGIVVPRKLKNQIFNAIANDEDISNWSGFEQGAYEIIVEGKVSSLDFDIGGKDEGDSGVSLHETVEDTLSWSMFDEVEVMDAFERFCDACRDKIAHFDLVEEVVYDRLFGNISKGDQRAIGKKYGISQAQVSRLLRRAGEEFKKELGIR